MPVRETMFLSLFLAGILLGALLFERKLERDRTKPLTADQYLRAQNVTELEFDKTTNVNIVKELHKQFNAIIKKQLSNGEDYTMIDFDKEIQTALFVKGNVSKHSKIVNDSNVQDLPGYNNFVNETLGYIKGLGYYTQNFDSEFNRIIVSHKPLS